MTDAVPAPRPTSDGPAPGGPDTIVLVHGFWVTPRSWEGWKAHYEVKGYRVLTPGYPGFEVEVEQLNADPAPIADLTLPQIVDSLASVIGSLEQPPILVGHSAGGTLVQILLDRGHGAVGVVLNSAPTEGVRVLPLSQLRSTFVAFKNPANRHRAVGLSPEQWHYAFTNTFSDEESLRLYERYHVPASGGILWSSVLANFMPGPQDAAVDYANSDRPAAAVRLGQRGPHHAAERAALERQALQGRHDHRGRGVRRLRAPAARAGGMAGDRRPRARLGRAARPPAGRGRGRAVTWTPSGSPTWADRPS